MNVAFARICSSAGFFKLSDTWLNKGITGALELKARLQCRWVALIAIVSERSKRPQYPPSTKKKNWHFSRSPPQI